MQVCVILRIFVSLTKCKGGMVSTSYVTVFVSKYLLENVGCSVALLILGSLTPSVN